MKSFQRERPSGNKREEEGNKGSELFFTKEIKGQNCFSGRKADERIKPSCCASVLQSIAFHSFCTVKEFR